MREYRTLKNEYCWCCKGVGTVRRQRQVRVLADPYRGKEQVQREEYNETCSCCAGSGTQTVEDP